MTIFCPNCHHENQTSALFCSECGYRLERDTKDTLIIELSPELGSAVLTGWGTSGFAGKKEVILYVKGNDTPIIFTPEDRFVIGRHSRTTDVEINLDLTPFAADKYGVSRVHAAFQVEEKDLYLVDLNSKNGTFLNEDPVPANQPAPIHDGDTIRLGQLMMYIYFK
ncbi:MAG: FHA domain-containing protein [Anaerolineae bacterium]|nr:FHA domain-containing protein [Anaerolineae bacterium]